MPMNDRSGVGYVAPQVAERTEAPSRAQETDENAPHSSPWSSVRGTSPVLTMNDLSLSVPRVPVTPNTVCDLAHREKTPIEESFGALEDAWLALPSDDDDSHHPPAKPASVPSANPSPPRPLASKDTLTKDVVVPNFQGPYLFFDLGDDDDE
jgi:hypothetical protein